MLAAVLTRAWRHPPPPLDLSTHEVEEAAPLLLGSGAGALGWWRVRNSDLRTTPPAEELRRAYRQSALRSALQERAIERAFELLQAVDVHPILFKGWAIARLYPEQALRFSGDIDLLVRPRELVRARATLGGPEAGTHGVDLWHEELDDFGERDWDVLHARSQMVRLGDAHVRILGAEDHLALLCIHFLRHGAWHPVWLCDIAVALESRPHDFDWDLCLRGKRWRGDWVTCALGLAHQILGADVRNTPIAETAQHLPGWLVPQVLKQWERPSPRQHDPPDLIKTVLRHPAALPRALRARWPDPIQATIRMGGPFNELPRFPFQLAEYLSHTAGFLARSAGLPGERR